MRHQECPHSDNVEGTRTLASIVYLIRVQSFAVYVYSREGSLVGGLRWLELVGFISEASRCLALNMECTTGGPILSAGLISM